MPAVRPGTLNTHSFDRKSRNDRVLRDTTEDAGAFMRDSPEFFVVSGAS